VALGLTVILADVAPLLHKKLDAPLAVSVADAPAQIVVDGALIFNKGEALTVTVVLALLEHPVRVVPLTV